MDLDKLSNCDKLRLCRRYYLGGFFFLPFLWCINAVWFFNDAFVKSAYQEQSQIRTYVLRSAVGATLWLAAIVSWVTIFQINRARWGELADDISFILPVGIP